MKRLLILGTVILTTLAIATPAIAQPGNDDLAAASGVAAIPFADALDTTEATTEAGEPVDADETCPPRGSTVWYALTLPASGDVRIDTAGSDYDTTLAVYTGTGYGDLSLVDCNDDTFFGLQAALTISAGANVTYLIQVGSFGGDGGGQLQLTIDEPKRFTGKPLIFKGRFKGLTADAFVDEFDETTGAYSSASVGLLDGQSSSVGKPTKSSEVFISETTETVDESAGTFTLTDWFGAAELSRDDFAIDKKLGSAWVKTDVVMEGYTCTGFFDQEDVDCNFIGSANFTVDVSWDGFGPVERFSYRDMGSDEGIRFIFRGRISSREANVSGGWSGDRNIDLNGAFGFASNQSSGDFVIIRGEAF